MMCTNEYREVYGIANVLHKTIHVLSSFPNAVRFVYT
jgi:hypothetical protein